MKTPVGKQLCILVAAVGIVVGSLSTSEAGVFPRLWNALFGPVDGRCYAYGCYYPMSSYAPSACPPTRACYPRRCYYPTVCSPCPKVCLPCGPVCSTYAVTYYPAAACRISPSAGSLKSSDSQSDQTNWKKTPTTFKDDELTEEKQISRKPVSKENQESAIEDKNRAPAPTNQTIDENGNSAKKKSADQNPSGQKDSDNNESGNGKNSDASGLSIPRLPSNEKVTWRVVPKRTRLAIRSNHIAHPTVARRQIDRNADWVPVPQGTKIAKK